MIRNNAEYMMPDGSPRFGIRTGDGLEAILAATTPATTGNLAAQAAFFTAHQLSVAGKLRYTARNNLGAEKALTDLRVTHPTEYAEAAKAVTEELESPKAWRQAAQRAARHAVLDSEKDRGLSTVSINGMLMQMAFSAVPIAALVVLLAAHVDQWIAFAVSVAVSGAVAPLQTNARRRTLGPDSTRLGPATAAVLWDDVVDATFINILEAKGIPVAAHLHTAATAGWVHLARTADAVAKLVSGAE